MFNSVYALNTSASINPLDGFETKVNKPSIFPKPGMVGVSDVPTFPVTLVFSMVPPFVTAPPVE